MILRRFRLIKASILGLILLFTTPDTTDALGTSTKTVPEGNGTNTNFKRTNNTVISGCKPCCDSNNGFLNCMVFLDGKSHTYCAKTIVFGRLLMIETLVSALPSGIDWVHVPSPSVVSGVANSTLTPDLISKSSNRTGRLASRLCTDYRARCSLRAGSPCGLGDLRSGRREEWASHSDSFFLCPNYIPKPARRACTQASALQK